VSYSAALQLFAAVGDQGTVLTSPDAIAWTLRNSGTIQRLNAVAWGGGMFLAAGNSGTATTSSTGTTWTDQSLGTNSSLRSLVYGREEFVLTAGGGSILTTTDGTTSHVRGIMAQGGPFRPHSDFPFASGAVQPGSSETLRRRV